MKITFFIVAIFNLMISGAYAQTNDTTTAEKRETEVVQKASRYVRISGEAGAYGELYSISGRDRRRPSSTGRLFFRPTLTLFQNFSISFDFLLSTEGSSARQQINQFAIHPEWGWGRAHIGDFSHELSRYSLSGINIRGGGLELFPGKFRFHFVGGQIQRAIKSDIYNSVYSRYLAGLKIGYGRSEASYIDLNIVRSKDNVRSISSELRDSMRTRGTTPQENLVISIGTQLRMFNNTLQFRADGAGSVFTRDINSSKIELEKFSSTANKIFIPRLSTNADYAYNFDVNYNAKIVSARFNYLLIGPGFISHGLSSVIGDKKVLDGGLALRFFDNALTIQGSYQNHKDNVASQKLYTTTRDIYSVILMTRPIKNIVLNFSTSQFQMKNDAKNDTLKTENLNSTFMVNTNIMANLFGLNHTIIASYSTQSSKDKNILRKGFNVNSDNISFSITTIINNYWSVSPSVSFNILKPTNTKQTTTSSLNLKVMNKLLNGKLSNNVSFGNNNSTSSNSMIVYLQSTYSLSSAHSVNFGIRASFYAIKGASGKKFNEKTLSLGYNYRF